MHSVKVIAILLGKMSRSHFFKIRPQAAPALSGGVFLTAQG